MGEHLDQYWKDLNPSGQPGGLVQFWQQFGYSDGTAEWAAPPSNEEKFVKKRLMSVNITLQCGKWHWAAMGGWVDRVWMWSFLLDSCLKWRVHPYDSRCLKDGWPPDSWTCKDNPDTDNNK